jgi:hypothetical protein
MHESGFSSWSAAEEQTFAVYEQRMAESQRKATTIGLICGAILLVAMAGIYLGVKPKKHDLSQGMNMQNLTGTTTAPAAAPTAAPTPAPTPGPAPVAAPAAAPAAPAEAQAPAEVPAPSTP